MHPTYLVELEIKVTAAQTNEWKSIIHITQGGSNGVAGDRMPLISLHPNENRLQISSYVNSKVNHAYNADDILDLDVWTKVRVEQVLTNKQYIYTIYINGQKVHTVENETPIELSNMKVYANDPWTPTPAAHIRNFKFSTTCKTVNKLMKTNLN